MDRIDESAPSAVRVAFAGIDHPHAPGWIRAFRDVPECELVGGWDPNGPRAEAFCALHGLAPLRQDAVFGPDVDAVIVNGRNNECFELATMALKAGKPIFLDKPGGQSSAELTELIHRASAANVPLHVGYFLRQARSVARLRELLASRALGRVALVRVHAAMPHEAWTTMASWFADPTNVSSMFQEDACHVVDVVYALFGLPERVIADRITGVFPVAAGEDAMVAVLGYREQLVTIDFTAHEGVGWVESWMVEVFGEHGTARLGFRPDWFDLSGVGLQPEHDPGGGGSADDQAQHVQSASAFLTAVRTANEDVGGASTGTGALAVFDMLDAVAASADQGARIPLGEGAVSRATA